MEKGCILSLSSQEKKKREMLALENGNAALASADPQDKLPGLLKVEVYIEAGKPD